VWLASALTRNSDAFDARRTVGAYLDYWRELHAHRWAPQTRLRYQAEARAYREVRGIALDRLRGDQVQAAQAALLKRGCTRRYAYNVTRLLGRALADAVKWRILTENVVDTVTLPTPERPRARAWDLAEIRAVLAVIVGHRFEAAYLLILWAGLRLGEVLALRWDAISSDGVVTVSASEQGAIKGRPIGPTKRERIREVDLPEHVTARLRALRQAPGVTSVYVLGRPDGGRWKRDVVRRDWVALVSALKIQPLRPHGGRRSWATMHMLAGTPLADLSVLLGHASPATTAAAYIGSSRVRRRQAALALAELLAPQSGDVKGLEEGQDGA
jgi:integrase